MPTEEEGVTGAARARPEQRETVRVRNTCKQSRRSRSVSGRRKPTHRATRWRARCHPPPPRRHCHSNNAQKDVPRSSPQTSSSLSADDGLRDDTHLARCVRHPPRQLHRPPPPPPLPPPLTRHNSIWQAPRSTHNPHPSHPSPLAPHHTLRVRKSKRKNAPLGTWQTAGD